MAPYFSDTGEMRDAAFDADAPDPNELTPDAPPPAAPTRPREEAPALKPGWPVLETKAQLEAFRAEFLADPWHPARKDHALMDYYVQRQWIADHRPLDAEGQPIDPETGERGELEIVGGDRAFARAPGEHPPVQMPALSAAAQEAGFAWNDQTVTAVNELADSAGLPRYHVELFYQDLAAAAEEESVAEEEFTRDSGRAALIRLEGPGRAQQILADAQALVTHFGESRFGQLKDAAEEIAALSNNPRVLIGAARLYRELLARPAQGAWEQILLGGGAAWAQEQAEGKARAAQVRQAEQAAADEARVQFMTATATAHSRWGRTRP